MSTSEVSAPVAPDRRPRGILVVDDEPQIRKLIELILRRQGWQVWTASSGREAVDCYRLQRDTIDLVLMDLQMPDMDGRATLGELLALNPDIRCCLMTGLPVSTLDRESLPASVAAVLYKPFTITELGQQLSEVLASKR